MKKPRWDTDSVIFITVVATIVCVVIIWWTIWVTCRIDSLGFKQVWMKNAIRQLEADGIDYMTRNDFLRTWRDAK